MTRITNKLILLLTAILSAAAPAAAQQRFERNIQHITFVPKGQWITGLSVNYSQANQDNYKFLIIESLDGDSYDFKVSPMLFYTFKDNMAAGGRLTYSRMQTRLNAADIKIDSETDYDIDNLYSISHSYSATAATRMYMSLGDNTRFGLFNELQLTLGGGQAKICNGEGADLTGTYQTNFNANIGLSPGVVMFLNNYSAIEVNVGVLGFSFNHSKAVTDQIYVSKVNSNYANFKVNLFSIAFGVAFYL